MPEEPRFKWQDGLGVVGALLAVGGMTDMPLALRIVCFAACGVCLPLSFSSHKNWPLWSRRLSSSAVVLLMAYMACMSVKKSLEPSPHVPSAEENAEATAALLKNKPAGPIIAKDFNKVVVASDRMATSEFWLIPYGGPHILCVFNLAVHVSVFNDDSSHSRMVRSLQLQAEGADGKWINLPMLPSGEGSIWFGADTKMLYGTGIIPLDSQLEGRTLAPEETIPGWLFAEYPQEISAVNPVRLSLEDYSGKTWAYPTVSPKNEDNSNVLNGATIPLMGVGKDFSEYRITFCSDLMRR